MKDKARDFFAGGSSGTPLPSVATVSLIGNTGCGPCVGYVDFGLVFLLILRGLGRSQRLG